MIQTLRNTLSVMVLVGVATFTFTSPVSAQGLRTNQGSFGGDLWIALFGVAGTSPEVINTLYQATARVMQKPSVQKKLSDQGVELAFDTPDQLKARLEKDIVKWREIVNASGARGD